jgi:capsular exopolysaccharide synthesis family protein
MMNEHLVSLLAPASLEAEHYLTLGHTIEEMRKEAGLQVIAVTSAAAGDGKTITAINLAGTLAHLQKASVLLVDVDLRRNSAGAYLGLGKQSDRGLADAVREPSLSLEAILHPCPPPNLWFIPAGRCQESSWAVLKAGRFADLLVEVRQQYEFIVLDAPPLAPAADCRIIERCVDGFLIVVAAHRTPRQLVAEALSLTDPAKVVGLVFNGDDRQLSRYKGYYYSSPRRRGHRA